MKLQSCKTQDPHQRELPSWHCSSKTQKLKYSVGYMEKTGAAMVCRMRKKFFMIFTVTQNEWRSLPKKIQRAHDLFSLALQKVVKLSRRHAGACATVSCGLNCLHNVAMWGPQLTKQQLLNAVMIAWHKMYEQNISCSKQLTSTCSLKRMCDRK